MMDEDSIKKLRGYLEPTVPRKGGLFLLRLSKKVQSDTDFRKIYIKEWTDSIEHTEDILSLEYAVALGWDPWQCAPIETSPEYKPIRASVAKKMKEFGVKKIDSRVKEILLMVHPDPYSDAKKMLFRAQQITIGETLKTSLKNWRLSN